jgi:nucleoid-associated protein YgaU
MERRAGACCLLSVVIVALVTVALYRPDPPPPTIPSPPTSAEQPLVGSTPARPEAVPEPTPGVPWQEPSPPSPPDPRRSQTAAAPASRRRPRRPGSAFATVGPSETLADVARRVYGTDAAADALWRANRDQLNHRDSPLRPGTPLRTPPDLWAGTRADQSGGE